MHLSSQKIPLFHIIYMIYFLSWLHNNRSFFRQASSHTLMRQNQTSIDIQFIFNSHIFSQHSHSFNSNLYIPLIFPLQNNNFSTHFPTTDCQPTILSEIQVWALIFTLLNTHVFCNLTPRKYHQFPLSKPSLYLLQ